MKKIVDIDIRQMRQEEIKPILIQLLNRIKDQKKEICEKVKRIIITPQMPIYETEKIYSFLLSNMNMLILVTEKILQNKELFYNDKQRNRIENILKIYENAIINLSTGEIMKIPKNFAVVLKNETGNKEKKYREMIEKFNEIIIVEI